MMTSSSNNLFDGLGASSSSVDTDYLILVVDSVQGIAHLVRNGVQLNERQCKDLYSKLVKIVENIQSLVPHSRACTGPFRLALKNLYRVLEKTKLLIHECCNSDLCRAAVFQICNEETFQEILLEVGLCFKVIYELAEHILENWERTLIQAEDLCQSSLFLFASEHDVLQDQEALKSRLEQVVNTSDDPNQCLARYLLGKLKCLYDERSMGDFGMSDAVWWVSETEPQETWKLLHFLGKGSGSVAVCCCTWFKIPCARKEFDGQVDNGIFQREAAILARLNHPNIVKFFCCSNRPKKGQCFIAMELMEMSLHDLIENRREVGQMFPISVVLDIITQIARGMCYLHGQKIAHRDLKPLNVVVTELLTAHLEDNFCVKLVDFGMSKIEVQVSKSNTISIPGVGTTKYRAPEVFPQAQVAARSKKKVNWFQADVFSFAVTCAQVLSLKKPFQDVAGSELYVLLLDGQRPELPQGCPNDLATLLKECWSSNPQGRPSFEDICSRLEKCKFQDLLKGSLTSNFEGLQQPLGYEYIGKVLSKKSFVQSQCSTKIPNDLDVTKDIILENAYDVGQSIEKLHPLSFECKILERKKKVSLWNRTKASFAQVVSKDVIGAILSRRSNLQREIQRKFEEYDVKPTMFSYNELRAATQDFREEIKVGYDIKVRAVYKGVMSNRFVVAVKQLYDIKTSQGLHVFLNEVILMTRMKHRHLVTLKGCCLHGLQRLLVYEYVEHSDVDQILLGPRREMVTWPVRLKICLGIARGMHYLHALAHPRVIHRDIKAGNVLLDKKLEPKIANFGLALLFPDEQSHIMTIHIAGTKGYLAPEYASLGELSDKVDVYSFGVLCLEIISGRHNIDNSRPLEQVYLSKWAWRLHEEDNLLELVDPTLHLTDDEVRDVQRVINVCLLCIQYERQLRPNMAGVVSILQGDMEPQEPKVPGSSLFRLEDQSTLVLSDEDCRRELR